MRKEIACRRRLAAWFSAVVLVGVAAFAAAAQKKPPAKPLDLNSASIEQIEQLPGIGPTTAKAIVQFREKSGPFQRVEDLLAIRLISKSRLEKLRPYVTVVAPAKKPPS
ncbi:MAG TPA: helix-hairpin-helix domain-containing protein [Candidatus Acidoferrum sp.]|nr:helix-hairpin-helix domain-containing protein [Candidatus Acidoferrum sp.]